MRKQEFTNLLIELGPSIFSAIVSACNFRLGLRRFFLTGRPLERQMLQPLEQSATRSGYRSWMLVPYRCRPIFHVRQNGRTEPPRSEERRVGKERVSQCRYRWAQYHQNKKKKNQQNN